jgi:FtsZ-interacting cell division protein YlmF
MACAVLLAGILGLVYVLAGSSRQRFYPLNQGSASATLSASLHEAELINSYNPSLQEDPSVHLRPIARITPSNYQGAIRELTEFFTQGRVVSVDLSGLSDRQSARLVDFCSGYLVGASGWLFRAAERVIVLTPTIRKIEDAP